MRGKKGLSDVVSTVLIILLVVATIAIIGAIVLNVTNKAGTGIQEDLACQQVNVQPVKCIYSVAVPSFDGDAIPSVFVTSSSGNTSLANLTFLFTKGTNSELKYTTDFVSPLEAKMYAFTTTTYNLKSLHSLFVSPAVHLGSAVKSPDSVGVAVSLKNSAGNVIACPEKRISCSSVAVGSGYIENPSDISDGSKVTVSDGAITKTFEFDDDNSVSGSNIPLDIPVDISGMFTELIDKVKSSGLNVVVYYDGLNTVRVISSVPGTSGNNLVQVTL